MSGAKARARVGIIVPTYNYGRFLDDCLSSVHQQGYSDYEVLIIDNASEDDTETIARRWTALDARFRYVRNETNLGPRESVLKAYELIESEFALILCADDCLAPAFLEQTVEALDRHPECTFAYTGWQLFVDRQGQENHGAR
ncbi:MAG TPA: glycosyltransferase family A protein, partial [Woeseiaceae bacterium]